MHEENLHIENIVSSTSTAVPTVYGISDKANNRRNQILNSNKFVPLRADQVKREPDIDTVYTAISATDTTFTGWNRFNSFIKTAETRLGRILPDSEYGYGNPNHTVEQVQYESDINYQIVLAAERQFEVPVLLPDFVSYLPTDKRLQLFYYQLTREEYLNIREDLEEYYT